MGLNQTRARFTFVNIKKGQLVVKKGNEVITFESIDGRLTSLDLREDDYQGTKYLKICLGIRDGVNDYQLQFKIDSGYGIAFCSMVPNIDPALGIKITPTYDENHNNGKGRSGMFINQAGHALRWYYKREDMKDLPELEKTEFKGQMLYDNSKQQAFFIKMLMDFSRKIKDALDDENFAASSNFAKEAPDPGPDHIGPDVVDDLPF